MSISYSFHLSNKSNAVTNTGKIVSVSRHNLRQYSSEHYDRNKIEVLRGSDKSILDDVKRIYHEEFDAALESYNKGKRSDRVIGDYLEHVSRSRSDVACEIIIQVGDKDFWEGKSLAERKRMTPVFERQLRRLEELVPEFRVASAIIHYDESSPHMHVVGVPVSSGYKKGLAKQVAKTKVFTADRLSDLQDRMRADLEQARYSIPSFDLLLDGHELNDKEKGRNKDLPKNSLAEFRLLKSQIAHMRSEMAEMESLAGEVDKKRLEAAELSQKVEELRAQEQALSPQIARMRSELTASEQLASEVAEKRQTVATLDRQIEELQEELLGTADITVEEMQLIKSDSIARNLVQRTIWATCEFLGAQGMLRDKNWRTAAVTANNPVLAQLKDPMTGFLQKVKEHMRKSINSLAKKKRKGR